MGEYSTRSMNKVHLIHWTCAVLSHIARKMSNVCILSRDQVKHDIILPYIVLNMHPECDMGSTDIRLIVKTTAQSVRNSCRCGFVLI